MKKIILSFAFIMSLFVQANAGGLVTNSNQSATYFRMLARGASLSGDAVYYNPAGLAFLDDGLTISLNTQMIWMQRTLTNDLSTFNAHLGKTQNNEFIGKLYVPVFPGLYAAYKKGNWSFSLGFNPPAGGGSVEFANGLPMLEKDVSRIPGSLTSAGLTTTNYSMQAMMKGSSIVYGVQAGASYKINEVLGVFGGVRMLFAANSYEGYLKDVRVNPRNDALPGNILNGEMLGVAELNAKGDAINNMANSFPDPADPTALMLKGVATGLKSVASQITDKALDVSQKGNGFAPLIGVHFKTGNLNLAAKYEFRAKITLTSDPKQDDLGMYPKDKKLRSDVPALLSIGGSYDIVPALKLSATYIHHFEPQASIESWTAQTIVKRQDLIDRGTNEYMAGLEWKPLKKLIISTGCQWSDVGVSDDWQNDITHNMDNFTMGIGLGYHFNDRLTLNIGGINTWYKASSVKSDVYPPYSSVSLPYTQTYNRTNRAVAIGIDYRF